MKWIVAGLFLMLALSPVCHANLCKNLLTKSWPISPGFKPTAQFQRLIDATPDVERKAIAERFKKLKASVPLTMQPAFGDADRMVEHQLVGTHPYDSTPKFRVFSASVHGSGAIEQLLRPLLKLVPPTSPNRLPILEKFSKGTAYAAAGASILLFASGNPIEALGCMGALCASTVAYYKTIDSRQAADLDDFVLRAYHTVQIRKEMKKGEILFFRRQLGRSNEASFWITFDHQTQIFILDSVYTYHPLTTPEPPEGRYKEPSFDLSDFLDLIE